MSVLAIEHCVIQRLPDIFSTEVILDLTAEDVTRLAAESEEAAAERKRLAEKLEILEIGLRELKRLDKHHPITPGK